MKIKSTGAFLPNKVVKNKDISDNPEWVEKTLGIKERRRFDMPAEYMALWSCLWVKNIDMIICATATASLKAPSVACYINSALNLNAVAFDVNAVCSGFMFAMSIAEQYLNPSNPKNKLDYNRILIIGADRFSSITDYKDRNCVFFGDGAGSMVLEKGDNLKSIVIGSDGNENGFYCKDTFQMDGKKVYKAALRLVPEVINDALIEAGLTINDIDYMVPHQPSKSMLWDIADKIGLPRYKVLTNMDKYANTSAATIPILYHESNFKKGDKILFASIGSGWTYAAAIYEY